VTHNRDGTLIDLSSLSRVFVEGHASSRAAAQPSDRCTRRSSPAISFSRAARVPTWESLDTPSVEREIFVSIRCGIDDETRFIKLAAEVS
jgi:hypothetical protein